MTKMTKQDKNIKNFPNLRFPGFHEEWEVKKLGDITTWSSGGTPPKDNSLFWDGDIPWISASSMRGNVYADSELKITEEGLKKGSKLAEKGTLLILVRGSMLFNKIPIGIVAKDVAFNQDVKSIVVNDYSTSEYILNWFTAFESKILNMVTGTGIGAGKLDLPDLKALEIKIPPLPEQIKLANFLFKIDQRISTQKKIISHLETSIRTFREQIFLQKFRFKDDLGNNFPDWEESKLENICQKQSSNISANKIEENFGSYTIYGASGILKKVDFYEEENEFVSIVKDGAGVGRLFLCEAKSSVLGTMDIIKPKSDVNTYFLFYQISNIDFIKYVTGSTIPHIYFKDYKKEKLKIPSRDEQTKIANFLASIDEKIETEKKTLKQYENQKKYLLTNLFV